MLFSSIAVLNGCGENCHPSLTDRSEAQALPQALSTAKVFIKLSCLRKMKDGHLFSQHAVCGQWKRGRDGGGDREKKRRISKEEEAETDGKEGNVRICECEKNRENREKDLERV